MGGSELLFILVVALILFGGKRLPELARTWGRTLREMRRAWIEIKRQMGLDLMDDVRRPPRSAPPPSKRQTNEKN